MRVGDVFNKAEGTVLPMSLRGPVNYVGLENITQASGQLSGNVSTDKPAEIKSLKNAFCPGDILYGKLRPNLNKVWLSDRKGICSTDIFVVRSLDERALPALYAYVFRSGHFNSAVLKQLKGAQLPRIGWQSFANLEIPLPPLEVQEEIAAEIEGYQKVIDAARAVVDNYRPHIVVDSGWPIRTLSDLTGLITKGTTPTSVGYGFASNGVNFIKVESISKGGDLTSSKFAFISERTHESLKRSQLMEGDILFSIAGALGRSTVVPRTVLPANTNQALALIRLRTKLADSKYVAHFLRSDAIVSHIEARKAGVAQYNLSLKQVGELPVPIPPLETQQAIVAEIEVEQALVAANRELIERFEKKIGAAIEQVGGEADPDTAEV